MKCFTCKQNNISIFDISSLYLILSQVSAKIVVRKPKLRLRKTIFAEFSSQSTKK